jgi:hypothetical protein
MIVDCRATVVARASNRESVLAAELDLERRFPRGHSVDISEGNSDRAVDKIDEE